MDTIADFITQIRNASLARKARVVAQWSKMSLAIANLLKEQGFIHDVQEGSNAAGHKVIVVRLKYVNGVPAITSIQRHSRSGCRMYYRRRELPQTLDGLGIAIVTTSHGVMTDSDARRQNVGGELLCQVW